MTNSNQPVRHSFMTAAVVFAVLSFSYASGLMGQQVAHQSASILRLDLPGAVNMAVAHNHKLELTRLAVQDSQEQRRIAESHYYPLLSNDSKVLHITELQGVVIPPGALSSGTAAGPVPAQTVRIGQGASTAYTSGTGLEQPLTQLFKVHAGVKAANADLRTAKIDAMDAENSIVLEVHRLYFQYLIETANVGTAEAALQAARDAAKESSQDVLEGKALEDAGLNSRVGVLSGQRKLLIAKLAVNDIALRLDDVLGLPLGTKLELNDNILADASTLPTREEAVDLSIHTSPTVLAALESVEKAKAGVSAARDAYIPNVTALARYSYQSGVPFLEHNFGSFGASVTYDLFDGGAREAKVRGARIQLRMAQTQLDQAEDDVRIQVSGAYDKLEQLQELVQVSQLTVQTREESSRIQNQRGKVGAALASSIASAETAASAAKVELLQATFDLSLAQSDVKRILGQTLR